MRIGITGHQRREGADWGWVATAMRAELVRRSPIAAALSSLAAGADQIFTKQALELGIVVWAILPLENYADYFVGSDLIAYRRLLAKCGVVQLQAQGTAEDAFFQAGRYIVDNVELMFAVWDGAPPAGVGGTADVVAYAQGCGRPVLHFHPIARSVERL